MLIETYLTVEDIERLRDQRLELLDRTVPRDRAEHHRTCASARRGSKQQIARFKPYSDKPNAPPLPDHLAEEMVNTVNGLRVYQESLDDEPQGTGGAEVERSTRTSSASRN